MKNTKIEWATHTFNPWIGCTKVSPGCANCYAETLNKRMKWTLWGPNGQRFRTGLNTWNDPRRWNREHAKLRLKWEEARVYDMMEAGPAPERPRVFCASLADWLDPEVPGGWRIDLLNLVAETPWLDWLLLTKRPEHWRMLMALIRSKSPLADAWLNGVPPSNVWLGTSAENQMYWDIRMRHLLAIPARVRFVSAEPLLGPIEMGEHRPHWLIVGGESGPGARPIAEPWVRSLRQQSRESGTAFFFKQWGGVNKKETGRELDGLTFSEVPAVSVSLQP